MVLGKAKNSVKTCIMSRCQFWIDCFQRDSFLRKVGITDPLQHFGEEEGTSGQLVNFWSFVDLFVFQTETPNTVQGKEVKGRTNLDNLLQDILHSILTGKMVMLKLRVSWAGPGVELVGLCGSLLECETLICFDILSDCLFKRTISIIFVTYRQCGAYSVVMNNNFQAWTLAFCLDA